jgi:hypothetical protein
MSMDADVISVITQFGAAGLIGVLWIIERRHAMSRDRQLDEAHRQLTSARSESESLLTVVKENTRAITALEASQRQLVRLLESLNGGDVPATRPTKPV